MVTFTSIFSQTPGLCLRCLWRYHISALYTCSLSSVSCSLSLSFQVRLRHLQTWGCLLSCHVSCVLLSTFIICAIGARGITVATMDLPACFQLSSETMFSVAYSLTAQTLCVFLNTYILSTSSLSISVQSHTAHCNVTPNRMVFCIADKAIPHDPSMLLCIAHMYCGWR